MRKLREKKYEINTKINYENSNITSSHDNGSKIMKTLKQHCSSE